MASLRRKLRKNTKGDEEAPAAAAAAAAAAAGSPGAGAGGGAPPPSLLQRFVEGAARGNEATVHSLLKRAKEFDVNGGDAERMTALHFAAVNRHIGVVRELCAHALVNVNVRDRKGETALMKAGRMCLYDIAQALVDAGADRAIRNNAGLTAYDLADPVDASLRALLRVPGDGGDAEAAAAARKHSAPAAAAASNLKWSRVVALYDYEARNAQELSLRRGQRLYVARQLPSGWWEGRLDADADDDDSGGGGGGGGRRGYVPGNFLHYERDAPSQHLGLQPRPPASNPNKRHVALPEPPAAAAAAARSDAPVRLSSKRELGANAAADAKVAAADDPAARAPAPLLGADDVPGAADVNAADVTAALERKQWRELLALLAPTGHVLPRGMAQHMSVHARATLAKQLAKAARAECGDDTKQLEASVKASEQALTALAAEHEQLRARLAEVAAAMDAKRAEVAQLKLASNGAFARVERARSLERAEKTARAAAKTWEAKVRPQRVSKETGRVLGLHDDEASVLDRFDAADVLQLLAELGLSRKYAAAFAAQEISGSVLAAMNNDALAKIGQVRSMPDRKLLLFEVESLRLGRGLQASRAALGDAIGWSTPQVLAWLDEQGYGRYRAQFDHQKVTGLMLLYVTDVELEHVFGMQVFGQRHKLLRAIARLKAETLRLPSYAVAADSAALPSSPVTGGGGGGSGLSPKTPAAERDRSFSYLSSSSAALASSPLAGDGGGDEEAPDVFLDPITLELMDEPVITADGHTYDRASIEAWLATHSTSPATGDELANKTLIPNHSLRSQISDWRRSLAAAKEAMAAARAKAERDRRKKDKKRRQKEKERREKSAKRKDEAGSESLPELPVAAADEAAAEEDEEEGEEVFSLGSEDAVPKPPDAPLLDL